MLSASNLADSLDQSSDNQSSESIAAIVLAAGASTRLGTPKQLLDYQGRSLLRTIIETAIASQCQPIYVVLGAFLEIIQSEIKDLPVQITVNSEWQTGIGSSIRAGIGALLQAPFHSPTSAPIDSLVPTATHSPTVTAAILLLCDQPFVTPQTLLQLKTAYSETRQPIIASAYGDTLGVPALFSAALFPALLNLPTAVGAKQIIQQYSSSVYAVAFELGAIDIDTPADYQQIQLHE